MGGEVVRGQRRCFVLKIRARGCETKVLRGVSVPPRSRGADQQVRLDMTATGHAAFSRTQAFGKSAECRLQTERACPRAGGMSRRTSPTESSTQAFHVCFFKQTTSAMSFFACAPRAVGAVAVDIVRALPKSSAACREENFPYDVTRGAGP